MKKNGTLTTSDQKTKKIVWIVLLLIPLTGMAVDLIAPSLPAIASSLQISHSAAKNAISLYIFGFAFGNFFIGFLSDAFGRQKLIRINLLGFTAFSLMPIFLPHIGFLLSARFLQGFTMGAIAVLARSILSDISSSEQLISLGTIIGTMWSLGPIIGPVLGGYLQTYFGWTAGFYFFGIASFISFIVTYFMVPETHFNRHPLKIKTIKQNLKEILNHQLFMATVILMGLAYSLLIVFNTLGPFLIQTELHYSAIFFGHLALCFGVVYLLSTVTCRYFLKYYSANTLFFAVINLIFLISVSLFIITLFFKESILIITISNTFMFFTCGFLFPLALGKGMSLFRHIAGTAVAIMYLINMFIASLFSFFSSLIVIQSFIPLMSIYLLLIVGIVLLYWGVIRKSEQKNN